VFRSVTLGRAPAADVPVLDEDSLLRAGEATTLAALVGHAAPGGLRRVGQESVYEYCRRIGQTFDPEKSMATDPILLRVSHLGVRVSAGQHRVIGLLERFGPDARVRDIPGRAFVMEVEEPDEVAVAFHRALPTVGRLLELLRLGQQAT
jgi:hypothetical protein